MQDKQYLRVHDTAFTLQQLEDGLYQAQALSYPDLRLCSADPDELRFIMRSVLEDLARLQEEPIIQV